MCPKSGHTPWAIAAAAGASGHPRNSQHGGNCSSACGAGLAERPSSGTRHGWGQSEDVAAASGQGGERDVWITAAGGSAELELRHLLGLLPRTWTYGVWGSRACPVQDSPMRGRAVTVISHCRVPLATSRC